METASIGVPKLGRPEEGPKVTAIIPVFNNSRTILPLLDSLEKQSLAPDEVIVVDDASTDNTAELAAAHPLGVKVVRLSQNSGPSAARNAGVEAASGDVIMFLDSDVVVDRNSVEEIKSVFSDLDVAAVNGLMKPEPLNSGLAVWYKCLVEYAWGDFIPQWDDSSNCINARIGGIRREVFQSVGGFDNSYHKPSVEDHEFGQRLVKYHKIIYDSNLQAWHHFSDFRQTVRNYWNRTQELLAMPWSTPGTSTDRGGASTASALEFLVGAVFMLSLILIPIISWWTSAIFFIVFLTISYKSLKYCLKVKGPLFYIYCLFIHAFYGLVVTLAGVTAFWRYRIRPRLTE